MEPTQTLNFNIPKLKRQITKDNLFEIDSNSRDAKELLANVARTYLDQKYNCPWKVKAIQMVRNTELEQEYKAKRGDMKEEGRHSRELVDQIAFCAIKEPAYITKIAKNGMMTKNLPFSIIGEHKSGVYLTKHADVQLKMVETISSQTITALFVFNAMLGKCKAINERVLSTAEPTPNYDCHVPLAPAQPSDPHIVQLQRSQVFFYEYDMDGMPAPRPRQCLPHAVITYEKFDNYTIGPLKSIFSYEPNKISSLFKKGDDKSDWKKTPRNLTNSQLPFNSQGWPASTQGALGSMTPAPFAPEGSPRDLEPGVSASNSLFNHAKQIGVDGQKVVVHRSASDPRKRFHNDEPSGVSEQQRTLPLQQSQGFQNIRPGPFDVQNSNDGQNTDKTTSWEPKPPHGFYSECETTDHSNPPRHQSSPNNNNNNNNSNNNNNNNSNNDNFNNNNSNVSNNRSGPSSSLDTGSSSVETEDQKSLKPGTTNCDNKTTNNTKPSKAPKSVPKKSIPFALNKKKSADATSSLPKTKGKDDQNTKTKDSSSPSSSSSSAESDSKTKSANSSAQKKDSNSTELDFKKSLGKVQVAVSKGVPFPKKNVLATEELPKSEPDPPPADLQDIFNKLFEAECKDNIGTSSVGAKSSEKGKNPKSKAEGSTAGQCPEKPFSLYDIPVSELQNLQDFIKDKIVSTKENEKKASKNNQPKIKTTSLKQGLKTTILLPTAAKNNDETGPKLEDLNKLLNSVAMAVTLKIQIEAPPKWEVNYQSFLKTVQKMDLTPGQHHKWVRKKEPPAVEPPPPAEIPPPPVAEVSIDDVVNTKLMKELLLERDFSESTSVSEADSLYLPPSAARKRRKTTASMATRRQTKKKLPFDIASYRRRRKRQKMQRKASAAEFDTSSIASTTSSFGFGDYGQPEVWESDFKEFDTENPLPADDLLSKEVQSQETPLSDTKDIKGQEVVLSVAKEMNSQEPPTLSYGKELTSRGPTLRDLGFDSWKEATMSLKFQPVVALKNCVEQITSHLHQEGSSNTMEWIGSQKELLETLNLPPDNSPVVPASEGSSKSTTQAKAIVKKAPGATSKISSQKSKHSKVSMMDYQSTNDTISINSIKASVRSDLNKTKKSSSSKKNIIGGIIKKKISKHKSAPVEIPRIKPKLPEKSSVSTKPDLSLQPFTKDVKKPTPVSTFIPTSFTLPSKSTLSSSSNLQSKPPLIMSNKTITPKGIIKNARPDPVAPKIPAVSPASFPATDQSLKVDLLMDIISAPPTTISAVSEIDQKLAEQKRLAEQKKIAEQKRLAEQKKLAEQKQMAEQKKQKISFQAYMEKHIKPKVKSPPREKINVFEAFGDFLSPEKTPSPKPASETPFVSIPTITPLLEKLIPSLAAAVKASTTNPLIEKLKPSLVMPPAASAFTSSVFSPLSPPPPISRDPRLPSKLPLPFIPKDPPLPKIIPTIPKPAKEDLKPILKDKPVKPTSHKKAAPLQKTVAIPLDDPTEPSLTLVDPRLSRKPAPTQPDFQTAKEPLPKPSTLNDPLLPRDPRILKMLGEYQSDGVVGNKIGKTPPHDAEGVSDVIGKSKPMIKNNTWNLFAIYTGDDIPSPPRRPLSTNEELPLPKSSNRPKPGTQSEVIPVYLEKIASKDGSKSLTPPKVPSDIKKEETIKTELIISETTKSETEKLESEKSELADSETESTKSESAKPESAKSESQAARIGRPAWGFYREMSPKRPGSEDPNSADPDFNPSLLNDNLDDNSCSDMDIGSDSPQVLTFENSDSDEDLTKPLYIDMSAGATPRRESCDSYKFSLKSPEPVFKKSDFGSTDPIKIPGIGMDPVVNAEVFKTPFVTSELINNIASIFGTNPNPPSEKREETLSPFNETVPPADPEAKNTSASSLFCAYQMEGEAAPADTSHIWMKSLSNLSKVNAVSSVNISDELYDVLRKVVKENIPAGQKGLPQTTSFPTLSSTKETSGRIPVKDLHKPGTLDKDYKLGGLDKDLFKPSSLDAGVFRAEDLHKGVFKTEAVDNNFGKLESSNRPGNEISRDEKPILKTTMTSPSELGISSLVKAENESYIRKTEMYSPTHPTMDDMSEKAAAELGAYPKSEEFGQGQAISVISNSRPKQQKSRSLSPTIMSPTQYLPTSSGWMAPQQPPPFWPDYGLKPKFDGAWQNMPTFNTMMTTAPPTAPIWPPPINMPPTHLGNIPFPPPGYINPNLPPYQSNQPDPSKPPNLYDWFADKITYKGDAPTPENNPQKTIKDPHVELVSNFLNRLSKPGNPPVADLPSIPSAPTKGLSFESASGSSTETKTLQSNLKNTKIPKSESFVELTSINTNLENSNSKADSEKSRSSSYSPTDKTSEIISISASEPSMSPGHLDSVKISEKGAFHKLNRTASIDSSLSSGSGSRVSKWDSMEKKIEEKPTKSDLPTLLAASPSSNDDSESDLWHKTIASLENKSESGGLNTEQNPSTSTPKSDSAHKDGEYSFSGNNDSATTEDSKRKLRESSEERANSKSRVKVHYKKGKKKTGHSHEIPKSIQISTINSKSVKDLKLAEKNRELLRQLAEQFSEKKGKSDLQDLLESVKQIKKELASQSSDEKESGGEKSATKALQSPRRGSEEKKESRTKKSEKDDKGWSEKNWKPVKPVKPVAEDSSAAAAVTTISSTSKNNDDNKSSKSKNTKKPNPEASTPKTSTSKTSTSKTSTSKTSKSTNKDVPKKLEDKESKSSKEDKNCDSELEDGELLDEESDGKSSGEENVSGEHSRHRSSRRRSSHRKRRSPGRRHDSRERFHKRRKRERDGKKDEGMSPRGDSYETKDTHSRGSPDRHPHDRSESDHHGRMDRHPKDRMDKAEGHPAKRMDYHTMDKPEGHQTNRMDYHPMDKPEGHQTNRMDYHPMDKTEGHPANRTDHPANRTDHPANRTDCAHMDKPEGHPTSRMDYHTMDKPEVHQTNRMDHPANRMDNYQMDKPEGHPANRMDYQPMDNPEGHLGDRRDYRHDGPGDGPDRPGFYPPNHMDNYNKGRPDNSIRENQNQFQEKRGRFHENDVPFPNDELGGHFREESKNYPDNNSNDYGSEDNKDRNPQGRSESYQYGKPDGYVHEKQGPSLDPADYIKDQDGLLYEKSDDCIPKGYSHNWPDRNPRGRQGRGHSPGREGVYPNEGGFRGNGSPPRDGRFHGNGSPPRDGRFQGNGSPPRDGRFRGNGSPPRDGRFQGNGSPPRDVRFKGNGSPPRDGRFQGNGPPPRDGRFQGNGSPPRDVRFQGDGSPPRDGRFQGNGPPPRDGRFQGNGSPPRDVRFQGNSSPPRDGRFQGNGSPPRDGRFQGNGSPPRDGRFQGNGSPPRDGRFQGTGPPPRDGRFQGNGSPPRDVRFRGNGPPPRDSRFQGNGSPPRDVRFRGNGSPPRDVRFHGNGPPTRDGRFQDNDPPPRVSRFHGNGSPPRDGRFHGNGPPPRVSRFHGNGSPPRDGRFPGNGSPPRDEGPMFQGRCPPDNWPNVSHFREIKIEPKNNCSGQGIGPSVSGGQRAAETPMEATISCGPVSYVNPPTQTDPGKPSDKPPPEEEEEEEEEDKKLMITFDTIDNYLKMFANEGSNEYRILKKALGVPLETNFNSLSKSKRKKIRRKIQSQLEALQESPSVDNDQDPPKKTDSTHIPGSGRPSFQIEDFQNFSSFDGSPNSMEHLKKWLSQHPDEDQLLRSRSLSESKDDSEDEGSPPDCAEDNPEVLAIKDPGIRRAVRMVSWNEKSPGFGIPHQRVPQKLLLAEEKDDLFSFEGCFLILMRKIPRKAVERLATLREVLNFLTGELQAAQKANDGHKFRKLQTTKNKLHERRKDVLEMFTGTINPQRLQTIKEAKNIYVDCLEYLKRRPDPLPNVDKEFVVKTIKAIQGHINMAKKFLDEQQAANNLPPPPPRSSIGFHPDMQGPPRSAQDSGWWYGRPRNMEQPMPGCYNQQRNNGPF